MAELRVELSAWRNFVALGADELSEFASYAETRTVWGVVFSLTDWGQNNKRWARQP